MLDCDELQNSNPKKMKCKPIYIRYLNRDPSTKGMYLEQCDVAFPSRKGTKKNLLEKVKRKAFLSSFLLSLPDSQYYVLCITAKD
jgi:hypothetical protein